MIYFIANAKNIDDATEIKIGYTKSPATLKKRLKTFACGNPGVLTIVHTQGGERPEEARIHRNFWNLRIAGRSAINERSEWFRNEGNLRRYLQNVCSQHF